MEEVILLYTQFVELQANVQKIKEMIRMAEENEDEAGKMHGVQMLAIACVVADDLGKKVDALIAKHQ